MMEARELKNDVCGFIPTGDDPGRSSRVQRPSDIYTKLDPAVGAIRILDLEGALNESAPIHCKLSILASDDQSYQALSYTWGGSLLDRFVYINGSRFPVTDNLFAALRRLRPTSSSRALWVDALCVNQNDLEERSHQVGLMTKIYGQAAGVIVWLGDFNELDDGRSQKSFPINLRSGNDQSMVLPCLLTALRDTTPSWWTRAWVIQEFVLAATKPLLAFGPHLLPWDELPLPDLRQSSEVDDLRHVLNKLDIMRAMAHRLRLSQYLPLVAETSATDHRDGVYSLLGLVDPREAERIAVSYASSCVEVFARTTYAIIGPGRDFTIGYIT